MNVIFITSGYGHFYGAKNIKLRVCEERRQECFCHTHFCSKILKVEIHSMRLILKTYASCGKKCWESPIQNVSAPEKAAVNDEKCAAVT